MQAFAKPTPAVKAPPKKDFRAFLKQQKTVAETIKKDDIIILAPETKPENALMN